MALRALNLTAAPPPDLWALAAALPPQAPVVAMIHGYRFSPHAESHDPHRHILALSPAPGARRATSWPRALGFAAPDDPAEGLALGIGWEARGGFRACHARAAAAGAELAGVIDRLAMAAGRPVGLIGHSLGARVALSALRRAAPGAVGRAVLLAAAELRRDAEAAAASPAGLLAEVVNVTTRENDLYDLAVELALSAGRHRSLGSGLGRPRGNWLDLPIDAAPTLEALRRLGFAVAPPETRNCHWSPYLRSGVFDLYRALLRQPESLPLAALRTTLPVRPAPRFSRLLVAAPA